MATGLPVIASDFPIWREIIDREQCGLLVNPGDIDEIERAMKWILDNPHEARAMGERGRKAVEQTYNWSSEASRLITLYERLLPDTRT